MASLLFEFSSLFFDIIPDTPPAKQAQAGIHENPRPN
jgi:hypothetical protein